MPMRKLEFYVWNGAEKQDYRLIAELGKKRNIESRQMGKYQRSNQTS